MNISIFVILAVIIAVKAWPCVSPIRKVFSRVNTDAVLQFTADLTNLKSPRMFEVSFFDGRAKARITYISDRSFITDVLPGLNITGDTDGNVVVTLPYIQQNDTGVYILTTAGIPSKCNCLYMLGIPRKPTVTVNKTPSVGESAILTCSSTSTTTPSNHSLSLKYSWRVNNIDNPTGTKYSYTTSKDKLTVSNILKEDANKQLTCSATEDVTDGYTSSSSEIFSFDVKYGPDLVSVNVTSPYVLTEGEIMSIECTADCYPGCTYTWINVTSGKVINSNDDTLYIESVDKYMIGDYQCKAKNTDSSYSKSADVIVSVNIKERTLVKLFYVGNNVSQSMMIVKEHTVDIRLTCEVSGDPALNVTIMFNDKILKEQDNTNSLTYIIKTASCFDSGEYKCEARNQKQEISHRYVSLFVRCSPRSLRKTQENITSLLGTPVTLTFVALAYPEPGPNGFTWFKEIGSRWTQVLSNEDYKISSSGLESNLTILSVSKADFGQYRVSVENSIGSYNQYIFLVRQDLHNISSGVSQEECDCGSIVAIAIVCGVLTVIVTTYAVSITILWKRNVSINKKRRTTVTKKDKDSVVGSTQQQHYDSVAYTTNDQDIQGHVLGTDDSSKTQYTDLDDFSREKRDNLYDAIKKD
ncbi:peroxidasin homolog [Ruditapes philippinarum]|uniref:peroxidasin homolog n=1 Tax=Ruditapes philippinarum TaxID=129788 RepID=UPI00295AE0C4|nr:peroxidasin homolog [Ruditapes philippinarum]